MVSSREKHSSAIPLAEKLEDARAEIEWLRDCLFQQGESDEQQRKAQFILPFLQKGDQIKARFDAGIGGGEWAWITILNVVSQTIIQGRLENDLIGSDAGVGDVFTIQFRESPALPGFCDWHVCEEWEQLPFGPRLVK